MVLSFARGDATLFRVASSKLKCVSQGCQSATLGWN
jgi:hypothetical protein